MDIETRIRFAEAEAKAGGQRSGAFAIHDAMAAQERAMARIEAQPRHYREELEAALWDYSAWCLHASKDVFPMTRANLTRYLLEAVASSILEPHLAQVRASHLEAINEYSGGRPLYAYREYFRALGFADQQMERDRVPLLGRKEQQPRKALEMFPDGDVPAHFHDVAA